MITEKQLIRVMTHLTAARKIAQKAIDLDNHNAGQLRWVVSHIQNAEHAGCQVATQ